MKKKTNYCLFCGSHIPRQSVIQGSYYADACVEPTCPHYGTESGAEYESLEGFSIIDFDEVDADDSY